jgi:hypothetical protein
MHEREYKRLKKQIEGEYRDKLRALDLVWKMAAKNGSTKPKAETIDSTLANVVRNAVERTSKTFTLRDVVSVCRSEMPNGEQLRLPSVSGILKRMADQGVIIVVEVGKGRRPTTYTKP